MSMSNPTEVKQPSQDRPTTHARLYCDSLKQLRAVAAFRGITVADLVDEIAVKELPSVLTIRDPVQPGAGASGSAA